MPPFLRLLLATASAGWLVPLVFGLDFYLSFVGKDLPLIIQGKTPFNSAPLLDMAFDAFRTSAIWLGLVITFWLYKFLGPKNA